MSDAYDSFVRDVQRNFKDIAQIFGYGNVPESWEEGEQQIRQRSLRDTMTSLVPPNMDMFAVLEEAVGKVKSTGDPNLLMHLWGIASDQRHGFCHLADPELVDLQVNALQCMLNKRLIGNTAVKREVIASIRGFLGQTHHTKPLSLMFAGTTGSGKTATAELIAKALYPKLSDHSRDSVRMHYQQLANMATPDAEGAIVVLDMGNVRGAYEDPTNDLMAIIGNDRGLKGPLPSFVGSHPTGVIVFDEIEKTPAHVRQFLLSIMDQGRFRDFVGDEYDARDFIVILTTNAGVQGVVTDRAVCNFRPYDPVDIDVLPGEEYERSPTRYSPILAEYRESASRSATPEPFEAGVEPKNPIGCTVTSVLPTRSPEERRYAQFTMERVEYGIRKEFAPEFLARIRTFYFWSCYTADEARRLIYREFKEMEKRLRRSDITVRWKTGARGYFIDQLMENFQESVFQIGMRGLKDFIVRVEGFVLARAAKLRARGETVVTVGLCGRRGGKPANLADADILCDMDDTSISLDPPPVYHGEIDGTLLAKWDTFLQQIPVGQYEPMRNRWNKYYRYKTTAQELARTRQTLDGYMQPLSIKAPDPSKLGTAIEDYDAGIRGFVGVAKGDEKIEKMEQELAHSDFGLPHDYTGYPHGQFQYALKMASRGTDQSPMYYKQVGAIRSRQKEAERELRNSGVENPLSREPTPRTT